MKNKCFKITDNSLLFVKYAIKDLNLKVPLSENDLDVIVNYSMDCELNTIDNKGNSIPKNQITEKDKLATDFGDEISLHSEEEIDLENLNKRLLK